MANLKTIIAVVALIAGFSVGGWYLSPNDTVVGDALRVLITSQGGTGTSSPSGILYGNGSNPLRTVIIGSNLTFSGGTLSATGGTGGGTPDFYQELNYGVYTLTPSTTIPVWLKDALYASSTLTVAGNTRLSYATTSSLGIANLTAASCDVKSTTGGSLYCGTDATSAGTGGSNWQIETNFGANSLTPTTTIPIWAKSAIYASSTMVLDDAATLKSTLSVAATSTLKAISTTCGAASGSDSVGGCNLINNTGNLGSALTIYSNAGVGRLNDLVRIKSDNVANDQRGLYVTVDGTRSAALFDCTNTTRAVGGECVNVTDVVSADRSTFGISGSPMSLAVFKITVSAGGDTSTAANTLQLNSTTTQGIFVDTVAGYNGKFLNIRNNGTELITASSSGAFGLGSSTLSRLHRFVVEGDSWFDGQIYTGSLIATSTLTVNGTSTFAGGVNPTGRFNPLTNWGDMPYSDGSGVLQRLPANNTATLKYLTSAGDGTDATTLTWQTIPTAGAYTYYLHVASTSPTSYRLASSTGDTSAMASVPVIAITGSTTARAWLTASSSPGLTNIPGGIWHFHLDANKTAGTKNLRFYIDVFKYNGSTETLLFYTSESQNITSSSLTNPEEIDLEKSFTGISLSATDRLGIRVYAVTDGAGTAPTGNVYMAGSTESRFELPAETVSVNNFVPYSGATAAVNLGSFGLTTAGTTTGGGVVATTLQVGTDYIRDLTGTGITNVGNALTLDATGAWTGTFDGWEGSSLYSAISTSSVPTVGQLAYWSNAGTPSRLQSVATTTLTATAPLSLSQAISVIGSSASALTCSAASASAAGCLSAANWTTFNNKWDIASSTLVVPWGGTGATTFGQGWISSSGGTAVLSASTSPTVNYLYATSTTVASYFAKVGIATSSPVKAFGVTGEAWISATTTSYGMNIVSAGTATGTIYIYSKTAGAGGTIILEDRGGGACTAITTNAGTVTGTVVTCPTEI